MMSKNAYKTKKRRTKPPKNAIKTVGEYYVEEIRDHAIEENGKIMYLLKWESYDEVDNSWEYEQQLIDCIDAKIRFKNTFNGKHPPLYSWQEFDNFCKYLKLVVSPSFRDTAVISKLTNKWVTTYELREQKKLIQAKDKIQSEIEELFEDSFPERNRNSVRLKAISLSKIVSQKLKIKENFGSIRDFIEFVNQRKGLNSKLEEWLKKINAKITKSGKELEISVANEVDNEVPQFDNYISESIFDKNIYKTIRKLDEKFAIHSCRCDDCYKERHECCSPVIGFPVAYNSKGVLSQSFMNVNVIFECNYGCKCAKNNTKMCANRVIQSGGKYKLELFRPEDAANRGWAVRTVESIPKGAYVGTYVGEVISLIEANKRSTTYLFDLSSSWDMTDEDYTYVIDAQRYGNIMRYVNHSCEPNCRVIFVWTDSYDKLLPNVCLFTTRNIRPNEELTYDYGMQIINSGFIGEQDFNDIETISTDSGNVSTENNTQSKGNSVNTSKIRFEEKLNKVSFNKIKCCCQSKNCRQYLYS